jgi:hypothetical protein
MFTPPAYNSASYYGTNGSLVQRVPTVPQSRPPLGNSFSYPNQFNASGMLGGDQSYNMYSPSSPLRNNQPYLSATNGQDFDQRSIGWGNSLLMQQQQFAQQAPQTPNGVMIFDRNLISAENARKLGLTFNLGIQEIDLIDLPQMHTFGKNCPFVSAACGKWTASTEVRLSVLFCWRFCFVGGSMSIQRCAIAPQSLEMYSQ